MRRRQFLAGSALLGAAAGTPCLSLAEGRDSTPLATAQGDLAIYNARVITLDTKRPTAEAVLVRAGRIALVGSNREVRGAAARASEFDARDRAVIPGFVDNHCHIEDSCLVGDEHPSLFGIASIAAMIKFMRAHLASHPGAEPAVFLGGGFPDRVAEKRWPTREDMDAVSTERPVMMILGIHASILNTAAWKMTGYWEAGHEDAVKWSDGTARRGSFIHRDEQGLPTGVGTELWDFRPHYSSDAYKSSMRKHLGEWFLSKGLTSMTTLPNDLPGQFKALQELQREGGLPARLRVYPIVPHSMPLSAIEALGLETGLGDSMLRFGGVKLFVDNGSDGMGKPRSDLKWTRDGLTDTLTRCQRAGLQTIMHVVTPDGMALALDCLEAAQRAAPRSLRHRIDHLTPTDIEQIRRVKSLGVTLGITAPQLPPGAAVPATPNGPYSRRHRYRTLLNEGVSTILVLDAAGPGGYYDVMRGIANVINVVGQGGSAIPGESVTLEEALRMWTLLPAEANGESHEKGSIEVGKWGDFAVLSADPRGRPSADVYHTSVEATILGGNVVFGS